MWNVSFSKHGKNLKIRRVAARVAIDEQNGRGELLQNLMVQR